MAQWPQNPSWIPTRSINEGKQYTVADGVTIDDINAMINNILYLKKYGGAVNILSTSDATVSGSVLILHTSEEF